MKLTKQILSKLISEAINEQMIHEDYDPLEGIEIHYLESDEHDDLVSGAISYNGQALEPDEFPRVAKAIERLIGIKKVTIRPRWNDAAEIVFYVDLVNLVDQVLTQAGITVNS